MKKILLNVFTVIIFVPFFSGFCSGSILKITVLSTQEKQFHVILEGGRQACLSVYPVEILGEEKDFILWGGLPSSISKIQFEFDDSFGVVSIDHDMQSRLIRLLTQGAKACMNYAPNPKKLLASTGKSYEQSGQRPPQEPDGLSSIIYIQKGITNFTGIGYEVKSKKIDPSKLMQADLAVLRSGTTGFVLQGMIYLANDIFLSMSEGKAHFQTLDQIKQLWDVDGDSRLELVDDIKLGTGTRVAPGKAEEIIEGVYDSEIGSEQMEFVPPVVYRKQ